MTNYAPAFAHDDLVEIFEGIYLLRGSIKIASALYMNRNMLVVKNGSELSIINAVRMNQQGLDHLEKLGNIKHIIRLGDFHGLDDQFYLDRYEATLWSQEQHVTYKHLIPQKIISSEISPPIQNAEFFIFEKATCPEAIIFLKDKKLLITTDSVQYWGDWKYMSFLSKVILYLMGFRLGLFIGGPWLKKATPKGGSLKTDFDRLMLLDFDHLIAAHGGLLKDTAKKSLADVLFKTFD